LAYFTERIISMRVSPITIVVLLGAGGLVGCDGGGGGSSLANANSRPVSASVQVSWAANREKGVNAPGGGYKVYYSSVSGFDIATAAVVDVPYISGPAAPTSAAINLSSGTYYFKVVGYSLLNSGGAPSAPLQVDVPFAP
jgi:hypothetical protein